MLRDRVYIYLSLSLSLSLSVSLYIYVHVEACISPEPQILKPKSLIPKLYTRSLNPWTLTL